MLWGIVVGFILLEVSISSSLLVFGGQGYYFPVLILLALGDGTWRYVSIWLSAWLVTFYFVPYDPVALIFTCIGGVTLYYLFRRWLRNDSSWLRVSTASLILLGVIGATNYFHTHSLTPASAGSFLLTVPIVIGWHWLKGSKG